MNTNPSPEESAEIRELLRIYRNLEAGRPGSFLEEEAFERLAVYFDEQENRVGNFPLFRSTTLKKGGFTSFRKKI
jgi:hypothetical protein